MLNDTSVINKNNRLCLFFMSHLLKSSWPVTPNVYVSFKEHYSIHKFYLKGIIQPRRNTLLFKIFFSFFAFARHCAVSLLKTTLIITLRNIIIMNKCHDIVFLCVFVRTLGQYGGIHLHDPTWHSRRSVLQGCAGSTPGPLLIGSTGMTQRIGIIKWAG